MPNIIIWSFWMGATRILMGATRRVSTCPLGTLTDQLIRIFKGILGDLRANSAFLTRLFGKNKALGFKNSNLDFLFQFFEFQCFKITDYDCNCPQLLNAFSSDIKMQISTLFQSRMWQLAPQELASATYFFFMWFCSPSIWLIVSTRFLLII